MSFRTPLRTRLGGSTAGLFTVLLLSVPSSGQEVLFEFHGEAELDFFGFRVSGAGDVDSDGHDDVVVGALGYQGGARATVFSGATGTKLHEFPVADFGSAAGAGDADGDGHADVIVGDVGDATNGAGSGAAMLYSGRTGVVLHVFHGAAESDQFGVSVDGAGDVDNDGFDDVIVGAHQPASSSPGPGYARVYSGLTGSLLHQFQGGAAGDAFGIVVAGAGDADADGFADVIVGAPGAATNGNLSGRVQVFSGQTGAVLHDLVGAAPGDELGRAVDGVGDVDGDGHDDVVVGAPGDDQQAEDGGSARVLSGADGSLLHAFHGGSGVRLGALAGGAGDVDGDDVPDLVLGTTLGQPRARVHAGENGDLLFDLELEDLSSVSGAGDMDADGRHEVVLGDPVFEDVDGVPGHEIGRSVVLFDPTETFDDNYCGPANLNSSGMPAILHGEGSSEVADNDLELTAAQLPVDQFGYFLTSRTQGFVQGPGSQGNLCLGGSIGRFKEQVQNSGPSGDFSIQVDLTALPTGPPHTVQPGETWHFQAWFRDVNPQPTSNFTDGLSITFD